MLTSEENQLLTQTGPGTPMGELLRRYWQPAALAEELPVNGAPLPIRLLGEDLVLFRDDRGQPGLLGIHCSHRGADLSYGRLEDSGLRCIYHGWLYDVQGRCLEQPGEPAGSTFHQRIQHPAYPCVEMGGLILTYLGPGQPPLVPAYDWLTVPDSHLFATKMLHECNFLQGNEGNFDPVHLSFLHRRFQRRDDARPPASAPPPTVSAELADFGIRVFGVRDLGPDGHYVTVRNFVLPNISVTATAGTHWHVPIDDAHHWKYRIAYDPFAPIEKDSPNITRSDLTEGYRLVRSKANRYLQNRDEMHTRNFSGLGDDNQPQDACVIEGAGIIQDRTQEHLGAGDMGIVMARQMLLKAIRDVQEGRDPPHVIRDPATNRFPDMVSIGLPVSGGEDWRTGWHRHLQESLDRNLASNPVGAR